MPSVRQAGRSLRRAPFFTLFAVLAVALGIGGSTSIFSVFRAVLIKPLPYPDAGRLVVVWEESSSIGFPMNNLAPANYWDFKRQNTVFSGIAAHQGFSGILAGQPAEEIIGRRITTDLFDVLGVKPALGRPFREEESHIDDPRVIILGHSLWRRRFNSDPGIIGRDIKVSGRSMQVVGVMPADFRYPDRLCEVYVPAPVRSERWQRRGSHFLTSIARLKPGVSLQRAANETSAIAARLAKEYPETNTKVGAVVIPLRTMIAGDSRPLLLTLLAASGVLLLIACANVANLMLTRASRRRREYAIRAALGARSREILGHVLVEATMLATAGCAAGITLAFLSLRALKELVPVGMRGVIVPEIDLPVTLFAGAMSVTAALVIALLPAVALLRSELAGSLQHGTRTGASRASVRTRGALVVVEVALSVLLVAVGALLVQRMIHLRSEPLGFRSEKLLTLRTRLPRPKYEDALKREQYYYAVADRVRQLPGVMDAGWTSTLPFLSRGNTSGFAVEGVTFTPADESDALTRIVTPGYMRAMGVELLAGRLLDESDDAKAQLAVVINETFCRRFFKSAQDALGRKVKADGADREDPWRTVVGVVRDLRERGFDMGLKVGVYLPLKQDSGWTPESLVVRHQGLHQGLVNPVTAVIREIDPELSVAAVRTMDEIIDEDVSERKQHQSLSVAFAGVAVTLAALGIFAVLSFNVLLRTREMGVRMAIGARPSEIAGLVVRSGLSLTLAGLVLGGLASEAAARLLRSILDRVPPSSPGLYAAVAAFFLAVSAAAAWWPARRAMSIDPASVLRDE